RNSLLLFVIPADTDNIKTEYNILLNELTQYNPELADKQRVLAISKTDLLDDELKEAISKDLPNIPYVFISAVTNSGLSELKDMLWKELNSEEAIQPKEEKREKDSLVHRDIDIKSAPIDDDDSNEDELDSDTDNEGYSYYDE
ncbi:MAG TPA: GTPase ObgE, partial [Dysgonamonadaceae bacterium]|nr:GTPase ObgE [Dysgonamonadaceae bacterium]